MIKLVAWMLILATACGPQARKGDDSDDDSTVDAGPTTPALTGRVWAPNHAPGQTAPGQEIPIAGALVWLTDTQPAPIPDGVYCEQCVATPQGGVLSGADAASRSRSRQARTG